MYNIMILTKISEKYLNMDSNFYYILYWYINLKIDINKDLRKDHNQPINSSGAFIRSNADFVMMNESSRNSDFKVIGAEHDSTTFDPVVRSSRTLEYDGLAVCCWPIGRHRWSHLCVYCDDGGGVGGGGMVKAV